MFLWSQSVQSLKLIVGFGYILILDYFSMSTIVGCSLIYSFELQNLVFMLLNQRLGQFFQFLVKFPWLCTAQTINYFIRLTVQIILSFLSVHMKEFLNAAILRKIRDILMWQRAKRQLQIEVLTWKKRIQLFFNTGQASACLKY